MALGGIWQRFVDLLPKARRQVGKVTAVGLNGKYTVQLPDGSNIVVRAEGDYQVNDPVFIVGDVIESKASALPAVTIEV